jgi:hypothetical protein
MFNVRALFGLPLFSIHKMFPRHYADMEGLT